MNIKSKWDVGGDGLKVERETHLEELESFGLQSLRGEGGEGRAQAFLTEAQGLAPPQGRFWRAHVHADKQND